MAGLLAAFAFVLPGQGVAQEQNPQPETHATLTAEAFSRTLTAALRQFEQAARRANPDQGPTLKALFLRAAFTNAGVPIAFVRRFGERPAARVRFEDLSGVDANASMAPLLRGALGCEQLDSACAQRLDREFGDLLEPTARALFRAQTLFTELDECLQTGRCGEASPEDQRLLHEAETFAGQTDLPQVFRALAVAKANRMRLPGAIECVLTEPLDLNECRDPITAREERDATRKRIDPGSRIAGQNSGSVLQAARLTAADGTVQDEGDIPPDSIELPPIERERDPEPDPFFTPPAIEDPCESLGPGCGDPGDLVATIDPRCPPGSEFKDAFCSPSEGAGGGRGGGGGGGGRGGRVAPPSPPPPARTLPLGFANQEAFAKFGSILRSGFARAGFPNAKAFVQGSAVTGTKFTTGSPFDMGRVSDFDIGIADSAFLNRAKELGIPLRSGDTRTGPLSDRQLSALGLANLQSELEALGSRPVAFMIFQNEAALLSKAASIPVP